MRGQGRRAANEGQGEAVNERAGARLCMWGDAGRCGEIGSRLVEGGEEGGAAADASLRGPAGKLLRGEG